MGLFSHSTPEASSDRFGYWALLVLLVLLPAFAWVSASVPAMMTKVMLGGVLVLVVTVLFAAASIRAQVLAMPRSLLLAVAWLLPLAYGLSTLFAGSRGTSAFGERLSMDSFAFILVAVLALTLSALLLNSQKRVLGAYLALVGAAALVSVLELLLFFARDTIAGMGVILPSLSLLGTLNDLAVFYGLIVVFVLMSCLLLPLTQIVRGVLWAVLLVALYFLAVVNLTVLWWILGLFALGTFVYSVTATYLSGSGTSISYASLVTVVVCAGFLYGPVTITNMPATFAQVGELDVRPSWQTTIAIGRTALTEHSIFGAGPGSFQRLWSANMPVEIANTEFWQTNFAYGVGFIPTSVITTGFLGALAWIVFLLLFAWQGVRSLVLVREGTRDVLAHYLRVTSFVAALFVWIVTFIQVPSPAILFYAFILTGMFVASLSFGNDTVRTYKVAFRDNASVGFLATLLLTVAILVSIGGAYGFLSRFLAETSYQHAARGILETGDLDAGEQLVLRAINLHPSDTYYRFLSGIDFVRLQNLLQQGGEPTAIREDVQALLSRAVGNAQKAAELDGEDYQNWLNLGTLYQSIIPIGIEGSHDSAIAAFDRVLALRPNSPQAHLAKATVYRSLGNNADARASVEQAISLRTRYTDAIFLLAQMQLEDNDTESAVRSVEAITLINPQNPVGFFQLGLLHYGSENFLQGAQAFERAVALAPDYANAHYFRGLSYWRLGDSTRAQQAFEKVQETNPDNAEVRAILSNLRAGKPPFEAPVPAASEIQSLDGLPIEERQVDVSDQAVDTTVSP